MKNICMYKGKNNTMEHPQARIQGLAVVILHPPPLEFIGKCENKVLRKKISLPLTSKWCFPR